MKEKTKKLWTTILIILFAGLLATCSVSLILTAYKQKSGEISGVTPAALDANDLEYLSQTVGTGTDNMSLTLTSGSTYVISSLRGFKVFLWNVGRGVNTTGMTFRLTNDLIYDGATADTTFTYPKDWGSSRTFRGTFDGEGHVISFDKFTPPTTDSDVGIFVAVADNAVIKNFGVRGDIEITGNAQYAGGLVGRVVTTSGNTVTIENCYYNGNIYTNGNTTSTIAGGLVGGVSAAAGSLKISNCYTMGSVKIDGDYASVGGILGKINNNVTIADCYSVSTLEYTSAVAGFVLGTYYPMGGIFAGVYATNSAILSSASVTRSYFAGKMVIPDPTNYLVARNAIGPGRTLINNSVWQDVVTVTDSYFDENCGYYFRDEASILGTKRSSEQMQSNNTSANYGGFSFESSPTGTAGKWYKQTSTNYAYYLAQLSVFASNKNSNLMQQDSLASVLSAKDMNITYTSNVSGLDWSTVKMKDASGNVVAFSKVETFTYFDTVTLPTPIIDGRTFLGWSINGGTLQTQGIIPSGTTSDVNVEAKFENIKYNITLKLNGGSKYNGGYQSISGDGQTVTVQYTIDDKSVTLAGVDRTGYDFNGWTGEGIYNQKDPVISASQLKDLTYTAQWSSKQYSIAYNGLTSDMMSGGTFPTAFSIGSDAVISNPKQTGYAFAGWTVTLLNSNKSVVINVDPATTSSVTLKIENYYDNLRLAPIWAAGVYTVSYVLDGGAFPEGVSPVGSYKTGETVTVSTVPTRQGYQFAGWVETKSPALTPQNPIVVSGRTENLSFTAKWTPITIKLSFPGSSTYRYNGGDFELAMQAALGGNLSYQYDQTVGDTGSKNVTLLNPQMDYRTFIGWQVNGVNVGKDFTFKTNAYASVTTIECIALFEYQSYQLTYELNGGEIKGDANPNSYTYGTKHNLTSPVRTGYKFLGWNVTGLADLQLPGIIQSTDFGDKTFTAQWEAINYTITYLNTKGVSHGYVTTFTVGDTVTIGMLSLSGYKFTGWSSDQLGISGKETVNFSGQTQNITLTASWEIIGYKVTLSLSDGSIAGNKTVYDYNVETDTFSIPTPTRVGYVFGGWKLNNGGSAILSLTIARGTTGDFSYTAVWETKEIVIVYKNADASMNVSNPNPTGCVSNETVTVGPATRPGYSFLGWTYNGTTSNTVVLTPNAGVTSYTLTANWEAQTLTITYELGKNAKGTNLPTQYTVEDGSLTVPNSVARDGYTFLGWSLSESGTPTKDMTIQKANLSTKGYVFYAIWETVVYDLTLQGLDGSKWATGESPITKFTVEDEFTIGQLTKDGYIFDGWSCSALFSGFQKSYIISKNSVTQSVTFMANWSAITYQVSYDWNGGESIAGSNYRTNFTIEDSFVLSKPVRSGYTFQYWYYQTTSGGVMQIAEIVKGTSSNITIVAQWKIETYTITYAGVESGDTDFLSVAPTSYNVTTTISCTTIPTKRGYDFDGWKDSYNGNIVRTITIAQGERTKNITYAAQWTLHEKYSIDYSLGENGQNPSTQPTYYNVNNERIVLRTPERKGYQFIGWTSTDINVRSDSGEYYIRVSDISTLKDLRLTANWEEKTFRIYYSGIGEDVDNRNNPNTFTITTETITLLQPTKTGYKFVGWQKDGIGVASTTLIIGKGTQAEDLNLTAVWEAVKYSITYIMNGGTFKNSDNIQTSYTVDNEDYMLSQPTRNGYNFKGWLINDETNPQKAEPNLIIRKGTTGSYVVRAYFELATYTITYFDADYGSAKDNPTTYTIETPTFTLKNPVRDGYTFLGWVGSDISSTEATVIITQGEKYRNLVYTAKWELTSYLIVYNLNGGSIMGLPNPASYTINDAYTLTNPVRDGYTFIGWQRGNEAGLYMECVIKDCKGDLLFAANWQKNTASLEFKESANGNALVKIEAINGFTPGTQLDVVKVDPATLGDSVIAAVGSLSDFKYVYTLSLQLPTPNTDTVAYYGNNIEVRPLASSTGDEISMTIRLYGAESGYRLVQIASDGTVTGIDAWTDGNYFIFTADELMTYAIVKSHEPMAAGMFWGLISGGIGVVLIIGIIFLLRFTVFRKYRLSFVGADIEPYRIRKGSYLLLPTGYYWFEDAGMTRPFSYVRMPPHDLIAYTFASASLALPYNNYGALPAGGNAYGQLPQGATNYLGTGNAGYLGPGSQEVKLIGDGSSQYAAQNYMQQPNMGMYGQQANYGAPPAGFGQNPTQAGFGGFGADGSANGFAGGDAPTFGNPAFGEAGGGDPSAFPGGGFDGAVINNFGDDSQNGYGDSSAQYASAAPDNKDQNENK